jgi:hypothetical protein
MRVTGIWSLLGAAVLGIIVADLLIHPTGTRAAGAVVSSLEKNTGNQLLGYKA